MSSFVNHIKTMLTLTGTQKLMQASLIYNTKPKKNK